MNENELIAECLRRRAATPDKTPEQIASEVLAEVATYRAKIAEANPENARLAQRAAAFARRKAEKAEEEAQ